MRAWEIENFVSLLIGSGPLILALMFGLALCLRSLPQQRTKALFIGCGITIQLLNVGVMVFGSQMVFEAGRRIFGDGPIGMTALNLFYTLPRAFALALIFWGAFMVRAEHYDDSNEGDDYE